jgi:hypothetical protein
VRSEVSNGTLIYKRLAPILIAFVNPIQYNLLYCLASRPAQQSKNHHAMFDAMAFLLSSIAHRLRLRRRNKRITSSSSATRRLPFFSCGSGSDTLSPFVKPKTARKLKGPSGATSRRFLERGQDGRKTDDDADETCVWRRAILLGQRCQPLEFNGAIHYDSEGRRQWHARTPPRTPLLSPVRSSELGYIDHA